MFILKKITVILFLILTHHAVSQKPLTKSKLNRSEIALLDIISKDTINPLEIKLDGNIFKFGLQPLTNSKISLLKNKNKIYIQPLGTGQLYSVNQQKKGDYQIIRVDSTFFNGANFNAINFFINDTLFQYGGDGYWHIRGFLTYFSNKTHEWELFNANRLVIGFEDNNNKMLHFVHRNKRNLYISNAFKQSDFPSSLNVETVDSVYRFNTQKHEWTNLGHTNPKLSTTIKSKGFLQFQMKQYCIILDNLELSWADFENNRFGKIKNQANNEFKETWLSIYLNNTKFNDVQFILGNTLYLIKMDADQVFSYKTINMEENAFDLLNPMPIYLEPNKITQLFSEHLTHFMLYGLIVLGSLVLVIYIFKTRNKKNKLNKQVSHILNNHFFESLTVIEKELIESLYEHHVKGGKLSTKLINKIIGVQNKDIMTQNKNRSDYFLKINQKFKFATHKELPLIFKTRDELDKRQFNYDLQEAYISELTFLIKK